MSSKKTPIAILFAALVIIMLGFGIAIPLMPFYVTHFNASGSALGLMMSLYSLMQFICAPFWGRLSDRIGRKPVLLIGVAGYAVSFLLQSISQNLVQFTLARTLAGILSSATLPTAMAYIADTTSMEDRSKGVGLMGAAMGLGMIFGPMLGGLLTRFNPVLPGFLSNLVQVTRDTSTGAMINLSIPFFVSALLALLAFPFIQFLLPESFTAEKRAASMSVPDQHGGSLFSSMIRSLRGPVGFLFAMAFLLAFALSNIEAVLALFGQQRFNMGPSQIGLLMGAMGILSVIQQGLLIGPLTRKLGEERIIQGGLVVGILGFIGLALAVNKGIMIAATLVFTAGNVLLQPSVTALISKRSQSGQGQLMGLNNSFQSLGRGIGPLWAGFAYDLHDTFSFWSGAFIQLLALAWSLQALNRLPAPDPAKEIISQADHI
jgi:DHA1 family multidrug resistance protein-like MFS transporter